ncbi:hypothetical protein LCGC14_1504520 [marine sediment metagenome]|uniref:Uncharacterized protein n=1 Tax=marine sediment metagenome TaxID=412755 RepID=A0A0F9JNW8_9ZZZZ
MAYGNMDDFERELSGVDMGRLGDGATLIEILDDELDTARETVDDICQVRAGGLELNSATSISLDGTGAHFIRLSPYGYYPLIDVTAITIDDDSQTLTDFKWDTDGNIEFDRTGTFSGATSRTLVSSFMPGSQNIDLTIDWGYATVNNRVVRAVYLCGKAAILERLSMALDPTEAAVPPGTQRWASGEFSVQFEKDGQYGAQMRNCMKRASKLLDRFKLNVMEAPGGRRKYRGTGTTEDARAHYRTDA